MSETSENGDARLQRDITHFDNTDILQSKRSVVQQLRELSRNHEAVLSDSEQSALQCADAWIRSMEEFEKWRVRNQETRENAARFVYRASKGVVKRMGLVHSLSHGFGASLVPDSTPMAWGGLNEWF